MNLIRFFLKVRFIVLNALYGISCWFYVRYIAQAMCCLDFATFLKRKILFIYEYFI